MTILFYTPPLTPPLFFEKGRGKDSPKAEAKFLLGFFRHNEIMPPCFLFSLRQGIVGNHARKGGTIRSLKKIKNRQKAFAKKVYGGDKWPILSSVLKGRFKYIEATSSIPQDSLAFFIVV